MYGDGRGGKWGELEQPIRGLVVPEKAEACCTLPLGTTAHTTSGDASTLETEVSGSDDGNAHTSVDIFILVFPVFVEYIVKLLYQKNRRKNSAPFFIQRE